MIKIDVTESEFKIVKGILENTLPPATKVWVFGSRAKYTTKRGSDLDIAIKNKEHLSPTIMAQLRNKFTDSDLPYTVGVVDTNTIDKDFYNAIKSDCIVFPIDILPQGWKIKTLDSVCEIISGSDHKKLGKGNIPVYGSGGVMKYLVDKYAYDKPTVLIPRKDTITNLFYLEKPFWNNEKLTHLTNLKKSTLQKAFRGEL